MGRPKWETNEVHLHVFVLTYVRTPIHASYLTTEHTAGQLCQEQIVNQLTKRKRFFWLTDVKRFQPMMVGWCINFDQCQKWMAAQIHSPDNQEVKKELGPGAQHSHGEHSSNGPKTSHEASP